MVITWFVFFLMIRRPPRSTLSSSSAASDVYKRQQVLEEFLEFIEGFVLVGHNIARFDMNFLYRDVEKYFERSLANDYIDTLQMARRELPNLEHHRLTDLAEYYGISAEGAHRALNCLLYTSDAADEEDSGDLGGSRIIEKKKKQEPC